MNVERHRVKLRALNFRHCEGNYSQASHACTWPCAITERDPGDQLTAVYGGQDNIQSVAGSMMTFWSELGFLFPQFPFIAHSRGWDAEDMQNNVRQVKAGEALREASRELVERAVDFWKIIDKNRAVMEKPMERAGRKANPLAEIEEAIV